MNLTNSSLPQAVNSSTHITPLLIPGLAVKLPVTFAIKIILDIVGALANAGLLVVCYQMYRTDPSSNAVSLIIMQMVACWFFMDFFMFPINDIQTLLYNFHHRAPDYYCIWEMTSCVFLVSLSSWTEVFLAVNRVVAICFPLHYGRVSSRKVIFHVLPAIWICAIAMTLPGTFYFGGHFMAIFLNQCIYVPHNHFGEFLLSCVIFLPMSIIGICCVIILAKSIYIAYRRRQTIGLEVQKNAVRKCTTSQQRRMEVAIMLFTSFLWGAACDLPYSVFTTESLQYLFRENPILTVWVHCILDAQYTISPFTMMWLNTDYRKTAINFFRRYVLRQRVPSGQAVIGRGPHKSELNTKTRSSVAPASHVPPHYLVEHSVLYRPSNYH
ncbi:hypothetical protein BV898_11110 [Hypsibius exemplaris]|uniref:G-protein coupled receptors family 1 profile domain-containing protein n=1 Tax=Hypsibius exemplaris TaxID=2072580 RepID=A0A1W0WHQ5_HYPEX|nr:hypothetical protein BV898_11110 [Hypsibius exemplaris]